MSALTQLKPRKLWEIFELICSVPHTSGHESALAHKIAAFAAAHGLKCRFDAAGNLRVDRSASPGFENAPAVILQGHLDMVGAADDPGFDFAEKSITPLISGEWVTADKTTLGADDGIGVALALALLCDEKLKTGALAGLFTVSEEVGLLGAAAIDPELLAGDILLGLDHGDDTTLCIGCAGGARQEFAFVPEWEKCSEKYGVKVTLSGLYGGHSGECIALNRGNAIRFLADFADRNGTLRVAMINGGDADNVIPAACSIYGGSSSDLEELRNEAAFFVKLLHRECDASGELKIEIEAADAPEMVWSERFQHNLLTALVLSPDGVLEMNEQLGVVNTSSNLATVSSSENKLIVRTSQRSMDDCKREKASLQLKSHFENFGASAKMDNVYPGWTPVPGSHAVDTAVRVWREYTGKNMEVVAIHAGLEGGWFSRKNPSLQLMAFGPLMEDIHTPGERLNIASAALYHDYLFKLLPRLAVL